MKIPVLMYHALADEKVNNAYTIRSKDFHSHMEFLHDNGYNCLLADDCYRSLLKGNPGPSGKSVMITFDDGHESDFSLALPVLRKFNLKANFFVTTDWIGKPGYMSADQLRALKKAGMSVQSHAKSHRFLDELGPDDVLMEMKASKQALEGLLGADVPFVSFPGGRYNRSVIESGKKAGYLAFFSSLPFSMKRYGDAFLIGRYGIRYSRGQVRFEKIFDLNPLERSAVKCAYYGKDFLKKVLGNDIYYSFWKRYITR